VCLFLSCELVYKNNYNLFYSYKYLCELEKDYSIDELDGGVPVSSINCGSRKRKKKTSKVHAAKTKRYSAPPGVNIFVPCKHFNSKLQCKDIRPRDVKMVRDKIYEELCECLGDEVAVRI